MAYHETRTYKAGFPITTRVFEHFSFHAHWHFELELVLVTRGQLGMCINSDYRTLVAGDIAICTCEDIHYFENGSTDVEVLIIVFHPDLLGKTVDLNQKANAFVSFLDSATVEALGLDIDTMDTLRSCLLDIHREMQGQGREYELFVKAGILRAMALLARYAIKSALKGALDVSESAGMKLIKKALHYIELHYMEDITLDDISAHLNVSPFYFSRVFSQITGQTFKNYLNTVKVEKAQNLIRTTETPILDVAYDCGFNSIRTFNRVFRNIKGYTPTSLR